MNTTTIIFPIPSLPPLATVFQSAHSSRQCQVGAEYIEIGAENTSPTVFNQSEDQG